MRRTKGIFSTTPSHKWSIFFPNILVVTAPTRNTTTNVMTTPRKGMRYPAGIGAPSKINQWVKIGDNASRLLKRKLRMKIVRAIGSVIRNPVRKTFRRRRLKFFITPYPLKSLGTANHINCLLGKIMEKNCLSLYSDVRGRQVALKSCFSLRWGDGLQEFCAFNFRLSCRLLPESRRKDKAPLQGNILCRPAYHLENHFFSTTHL